MNGTATKRSIDLMEKLFVNGVKVVNKNNGIESEGNIPSCVSETTYGC
tara:strand:- start:325 stop:468 length:144 start_codon:yes stop_codon:yes gene_type:complete